MLALKGCLFFSTIFHHLFNLPQTSTQKAQLQAYKKEREKRYKGEFVAKEPLLSQVY